ncbi:PREDICTED: TATA box-binding protein-associated factor RNA polymerase I subunit B [Polistes dominula]|uniref:TATA box-binding protein-associated factor RNA polymerase I subunit B n=1 Tax=Polistes dominula TaxID=743375 RepID=A0ABM1IB18_POLDO|nr:PREDICTED: TATA box-binding protein-associated factor RNA polymerase I subunit B [Polistes dominula]XP_015177406.1 PREDICTED: TATA box-binding protein-associated factor RNA polymerase I subunit B [Polistes dominula]
MEENVKVNSICRICGCTNFFKDAGFYYCENCQTRNEEIREEIFDMRVDPSTKLRKIKIKHADRKHNETQGWTTWEIYNFALIGLTEEMIELGASPDIKFTVLQLWSTYLSKLEVAFTSISKKSLPRLSKQYHKNDAEIIYGKVKSKKKIIKRNKLHTNSTNQSVVSGSTSAYSASTPGGGSQGFHRNKKLLINSDYEKYLKSQTNSDAVSAVSGYSTNTVKSFDKEERISFNKFAKEEKKKITKLSKNVSYIKRVKYREKHTTSQYKTGPYVITGIKLWAIIYLAMRIHKEPIQLGDMLRFAREGHMSYYKLDHLIPSEVKLSQNDVNFLTQNTEITHKGIRKIAARMAKFIGIRKLSSPNLLPLISRYCQELALPRGILLYAERFIALSPPTMIFDFKKADIPNYEARAMAFIIVVLKILFGLDGITEYTISKIAEHINIVGNKHNVLDKKLFSFYEWQRYIECRKNILVNKHYPTKLKYNPTLPLSNNMYLNFMDFINSKKERENPEIINYKHLLPRDLSDAMKRCFEKLNQNNKPESDDVILFYPSLTPFYSYLQQLWENSSNDIPDILRSDFYETKVGYMTHIKDFQQLATQCNINLKIINSRSHFINKIVPYFERYKMEEVAKLKEDVKVCDINESEEEDIKKIENFVTFVDKNTPCYTRIDDTKLQYFDDVRNLLKMNTNVIHNDHKDFIFEDVLPNGKLLIPQENNSTSDDDDNVTLFNDTIKPNSDITDINFYQKYNIELSKYEHESILKPQYVESIEDFMKRKMHRYRNAKGQFMKASEAQEIMNNLMKPNVIDNLNFYDLHNFTGINLNDDDDDLSLLNIGEMNLPEMPCDIPIKEEQVFNEEYNFKSDLNNENNYFNLSDISILNDDTILDEKLDINETKCILNNDIDSKEQESKNMKFFRPCEDYWMYHCIFSRVKAKNFELFEKVLPRSFRWLLNECANILEMTTEELYEEICTIENFYSQILNPNNVFDHSTRIHRSIIINKW